MSAPLDHLLRKICENGKSETYNVAKRIMRTAHAKTGAGSGYELGKGASGLPAICAYLASSELNNGDISQAVAQAASCLDPKTFKKTLSTVQRALSEINEQSGSRSESITYEILIRSYKIPMVGEVTGWMKDVEKTLLKSDGLRGRYDGQVLLICTIFLWTCSLLKIDRVDPKSTIEKYKLSVHAHNNLWRALDKVCHTVGTSIQAEVEVLREEKRRSPSKPTPSSLPRKSPSKSPFKSAIKTDTTTATPSKLSPQKRKVVFSRPPEDDTAEDSDEGIPFPETPTKKRRIEPPPKSRALPRKELSDLTPTASSSSSTSAPHPRKAAGEAIEFHLEELSLASDPPRLVTVSPVAEPSTPRKSQRNSKPSAQASAPRSETLMDVDDANSPQPSDGEEDEEPHRPRRFRPVFLDHKQWYQQDPRIEQQWRQIRASGLL